MLNGCQVDFLATLEGAPDLQLTVHAQEVQMRGDPSN